MNSEKKFDEEEYLNAFPDVAAAVRDGTISSGYEHYQKFGIKEGRKWSAKGSLSREEKVLHSINQRGQGLEIGPSYNPIAQKKQGFNVEILDHLNQEQLREKYTGHGVDIDNIEEVDHVWSGEPISELVGNQGSFDWIIASHVIEHIPNPVLFLQECEKLLKPDGVLSLVIPDKYFCFDYFHPVSSTGQFLDAYEARRSRPSVGQIYDHFSNSCKRDGENTWSQTADPDAKYELIHPVQQAKAGWQQARDSDIYIDTHCWRFTPPSFRLLMADLGVLELCRLRIVTEFDTSNCEFYVSLKCSSAPLGDIDRVLLLQSIIDYANCKSSA